MKPCQLTQAAINKAELTQWMWYKSHNNDSWVKQFVVLSESLILAYTGRIAYKHYHTPSDVTKLLREDQIFDGDDVIAMQEFISKKGKVKWSKRFCALRRDGYIDYTSNDGKSVKTADFYNAHIEINRSDENVIQWKQSNGHLIQFRFDSITTMNQWLYRMQNIQKICKKTQKSPRLPVELKSIYTFTLRHKLNNFRGSSILDEQYFGFHCFEDMELWKNTISETITKMYFVNDNPLVCSLQPIQSNDDLMVEHFIKMIECNQSNKNHAELRFEHSNGICLSDCIDKVHTALFEDESERIVRCILDSKNNKIFLQMINFLVLIGLELDLKKKLSQIIAHCIGNFGSDECLRFVGSLTDEKGKNEIIQLIFENFDVNSNRILMALIKHTALRDMFLNKIRIKNMSFMEYLLQMMSANDLILISCSYESLHCLITQYLNDQNTMNCLKKYFDEHQMVKTMIDMVQFGNCLAQRYSLRLLDCLQLKH